jgi:hypothetical protein
MLYAHSTSLSLKVLPNKPVAETVWELFIWLLVQCTVSGISVTVSGISVSYSFGSLYSAQVVAYLSDIPVVGEWHQMLWHFYFTIVIFEWKKLLNFQSCANELCLHFRAALEAKSELYDRLSRDSSVTAVDTKYLVNFQQKVSDDYNKIGETSNMKGPEEDQEDEEHLSDEYDEPLDPEEDWYAVGYLGRGFVTLYGHCCIFAFTEGVVYSRLLCQYNFCCDQSWQIGFSLFLFLLLLLYI